MAEIKYDYIIDRTIENYTANKLLKHIPMASTVLDVGCATGYLSRIMQSEFQCAVTGIELQPEAAQRARSFCERVLVGDVEQMALERKLPADAFDVIVFADILEHLKKPAEVLRQCSTLLKPEGFVLVSVPNFGYKGVLHGLFSGRLEKRSHGILDATHRQFYTLDGVLDLLASGGLLTVDLDRTVKALEDSEFIGDRLNGFPNICEAIEQGPEVDTYQFIVKARPANATGVRESADYLAQVELGRSKSRRRWRHDRKAFQEMAAIKNQMIDKRDKVIAAKNCEVAKRDEVIATKNQDVIKRDEVIAVKNQLIAKRDAVIENKNQYITRQEATLDQKNQMIAQLQEEIDRLYDYARTSPVYRFKQLKRYVKRKQPFKKTE